MPQLQFKAYCETEDTTGDFVDDAVRFRVCSFFFFFCVGEYACGSKLITRKYDTSI